MLGDGIGQAVAEVQPGRMARATAVALRRIGGELGNRRVDRRECQFRIAQ